MDKIEFLEILLKKEFFIYCFERKAYWKKKLGYSVKIDEAGKYTLEDALNICRSANIVGINEAMIPCE